MKRYLQITLAVLILCGSLPAFGQTDPAPIPDTGQPPAGEPAQPASQPATMPSEQDTLKQELEQIRQQDAAKEQRLQSLEQKLQRLEEEREREAELAQITAAEASEAAFKPSLRLYGFFDMTLGQHDLKDSDIAVLYVHNTWSFALTRFNLFVDSQMTETLGTLAEVRFTFLPLGQVQNQKVYMNNNGQLVEVPGTEFQRVDTHVIDPVAFTEFNLGGIQIERVHLTYTPLDWFNIIAGRFITPFGIWNVDHGSPVVITARLPQLLQRQFIPLAQTGIQVYGHMFPYDTLQLDYAVTLSNGRGPLDEVYDLDDNKGLGLRLRLIYEQNDISVAVGAHGYMGSYRDVEPTVVIDPVQSTMEAKKETTEDYDELSISTDLQLKFFGFKLQAEYVRQRVTYSQPLPVPEMDMIMELKDPIGAHGPYYVANYIAQGFYLLSAYTLPLERWLGQVQITPFFLFEYNDMSDVVVYTDMKHLYEAGLNIRPTPVLVFKLDWSYIESPLATGHTYLAQMAVSF
jgi:hypothetical protein